VNKLTSQAARFVRIFVFAAGPALLALLTGQGPVTIGAVAAISGPALEVAWRGIHPTVAAVKGDVSTSSPAEPFRPV
jgi:hypothetical protein